MEIPLNAGYWGSVSAGAALDGKSLAGDEIAIAESLAGPIQTLIRTDAGIDGLQGYSAHNAATACFPGIWLSESMSAHANCSATGRATAYGSEMHIDWPES